MHFRAIGYTFYQRISGSVLVSLLGKRSVFEILHTIPFNSTRKRMSIVVRTPEGTIIVFCKGADDVIIGRRKKDAEFDLNKLMNQINSFSSQGLRTLCLSMKIIDAKYWSNWKNKYNIASAQVNNRQVTLDALADEIEGDLEFLGATAIEDNLQQGLKYLIYIF